MNYWIYIPNTLDLYTQYVGSICSIHWIYMSYKRYK
nr:MAG TPA: hypothetical protein [Caudoviricetes sp.]